MSKRLYIGNLANTATEDDLEALFSKFGEIVEISIKDQGTHVNYAFVEYKDLDSADNAQSALNEYELQGYRMHVEYTRGPKYVFQKKPIKNGRPKRTKYRVEVEHLPKDCSWQDLKDYMSTVGPVGYCNIRGDYGAVEFLHYDDMKRAVRKLDDTKLKSRNNNSSYIRVYSCYHRHHHHHHHHRRHRSYSYSDSYSPSRSSSSYSSRSRSRSHSSRSRSRSRSKSADNGKMNRSVPKSADKKMSESPKRSVERSVSQSRSASEVSRSSSRRSSSRRSSSRRSSSSRG